MDRREGQGQRTFAPADQAGHNGRAPVPQSDAEMRRRSAVAREVAAGLGQIVSLMIMSRHHKHCMVAELEWLVVPPVTLRQFRVVESPIQGSETVAPVAAVMWAEVDAEVDKRLSETLDQPIRLRPDQWKCGEIVWIVDAVGDTRAINAMLQHLKQNELKDRTVRMRVKGQDGRPIVGRVEVQPDPPASAKPS